jgi:antitoxin HigA-1
MTERTIKIGMKPPHPGAFIHDEVLEPLDLSVAKAAKLLDVRRATLSDLVNAKARLSPEMARRLEMAFDLDMNQMLRMQAWFDTQEMRERGDIRVARYEELES